MGQEIERQIGWAKIGLASFLVSINIILSRSIQAVNSPRVRMAKLSIFLLSYLAFYKMSILAEKKGFQTQFEFIKKHVAEPGEIERMERAWQLKNVELEQDKKALAKYKLDPQSYH